MDIYLNNNLLLRVPNWCEDHHILSSALPDLRVIEISSNSITDIGKNAFLCLPRVEVLNLDGINIGKIRSNIFASMKMLKTFTLSNIGSSLFKKIEDYAFNSSSLISLSMEHTNFHFNKDRFNPQTIFASSPNLEYLSLTNNYLSNDETIFWKMFSPLVKLKKLILSSASLSILPRYVFTNLNNLRELSLAANKIRSWGDGTVIFQNMTSLKKLDLSNNLIKTVNKTSFPSNLLHSIGGIDLSNNPFTCDCDLLWFSDFLKSTPTKCIRYPLSYRCNQPSEMDPRLYHAFVVYCDSDRSWVHETFLGRMEQEKGVKLCIHHRDFDVGESITENIDKYLERSWKVVIIISNEFAKSEWCQWVVDVVQERRRRHGRDVVLLIMLESIDSKHMTRRLRTLLDSASPIMYQRGLGEVTEETIRRSSNITTVTIMKN
ncbi:toll-like receptor 13 [Mytilus edulis]|uniref:toll-like receptor 13 n=1 Tax=Mytilus edulis TaxID=6550 RepID=UPI0039F135B4